MVRRYYTRAKFFSLIKEEQFYLVNILGMYSEKTVRERGLNVTQPFVMIEDPHRAPFRLPCSLIVT